MLRKFALFIVTFLIVIIFTQEFFFTISPIKKLELRLLDDRFSRRGSIEIKDSTDIIIVEITQETYDQIPHPYKTWPWPRFIFAHVIENLIEAEVRAIGIDILMSNPDRMDPKNDSILANSIKKYGNIVVAGKLNLKEELAYIHNTIGSLTKEYEDSTYTDRKIDLENIFYNADSSIGIVQVPSDYDDVYRRYQPYVTSKKYKSNYPTFSFGILNKYFGLSPVKTVEIDHSNHTFQLAFKDIPQYDDRTFLINFYGGDRTFPRVDLSTILDDKDFTTSEEIEYETEMNYWDDPDYGELYKGIFKDKIVLIGSSMPEDKDFFNISFSKGEREGDNIVAGVEFHANAIQNVIWDDYLYKQPVWQEIMIIFLIMFFVFYGSSFIKKQKSQFHSWLELLNILFVFLISFGIYELGFYLFVKTNLVVSIVNPILGLFFAYFSVTAYHFITERIQNKMIRGMFSTYVSRDLVDTLISDPGKLKLGGERKNLTILFSDIAGFTSFSEKLSPEDLVVFINEYLTEMTDIVMANNGTLDKYIGDAVMAFWGAPIEIERKEYLACKTAIEMMERLENIRERWERDGETLINIRIGINSGDVVVGNIGGQNRFDYTVMGDNVNLASRLEGANKQYGTGIMISESTYEKVSEEFVVRELDTVLVKGKAKPTKVYELIGHISDELAQNKIKKLGEYFKGLELYKQKKFEEAQLFFERSFNSNLQEDASHVYLMRCKYYLENPPDQNWDGVFVMKTK